jgi:hypothetical protein
VVSLTLIASVIQVNELAVRFMRRVDSGAMGKVRRSALAALSEGGRAARSVVALGRPR